MPQLVSTRKSSRETWLALLFFAAVAAICMWPVLRSFTTTIYATPGDPQAQLHTFWWSITHTIPFNFPSQPLLMGAGQLLSKLFGDVAAYNLIVLFQFMFSAIPFYLIVRKFTKSQPAALLSGLIMEISPYRLARASQHLNLANVGFIGFFLYFLFESDENPSTRNMLLASSAFVLATLESYQYGLFIGALFVLFLFCKLCQLAFSKIKPTWSLKRTVTICLGILISFSVIGVFASSFFSDAKSFNEGRSVTVAPVRNKESLTVYSAKTLYYLAPAPTSMAFGSITTSHYSDLVNQLGTNTTEQIIFLGYTSMALSLIFLCYFLAKHRQGNPTLVVWFLLLVATVGTVLSFSAPWKIGSRTIDSPAMHIFAHLPFFRAYVRLGLFPLVAVTIFSGLALPLILSKCKTVGARHTFTALLFIFVVTEFAVSPASSTLDVSASAMPPVYQWLETQAPGSIAEYPFYPQESPLGYDYLVWHRVYNRALVNYSDANQQDTLFDVSRATTINQLANLGVTYIVIHEDRYLDPIHTGVESKVLNGGSIPLLTSPRLNLAATFGSTKVYQLR